MEILPANTRDRQTQAQIIIDWFEGRIGDHELSEKNQEYFERVKMCYRSQMSMHARSRTIKILVKTYEISAATAQRIYNETEEIYGSQTKFNKEFKRHKAEEMALATYRKAKQLNAPKTMVQAVQAYISASGIKDEISDLPSFQDIDPGDVITLLPEAIANAILARLDQGAIDLNQADYIDVTHAEPRSEDTSD